MLALEVIYARFENLSEVKSAGAGFWPRPQWRHFEQCADWSASFRPSN